MTQPSDNWFWAVVLSFFGLIFMGGVYDFVFTAEDDYKDLVVYSDIPLPSETFLNSENSKIAPNDEAHFAPQLSSSDLYLKDDSYQTFLFNYFDL